MQYPNDMPREKLTKKKLISLSTPQERWLVNKARGLGISVAELIRRIIDSERLEKRGDS